MRNAPPRAPQRRPADEPPCHGAVPEQRCWNEHQLRQFLHVAMTHRLRPAIWLAAMTGMRRGEVLGLRWSDIDLDASTPRPCRSAGRSAAPEARSTPPTPRPAPPDDPSISTSPQSRCCATGSDTNTSNSERSCPTRQCSPASTGNRSTPHALSPTFNRLQPAARVPTIRLHDYADLFVMSTQRDTAWSGELKRCA